METKHLFGIVVIAVVLVLLGTLFIHTDGSQAGDDLDSSLIGSDGKEVGVGEHITVALRGNATTGYDWKVVSTDGPRLVRDWYVVDDKSGNMVGVGGIHYFTFSCDKAGEYDIVFDYQRSWQGSEGNTETYHITVK